MGHLSSLYKHSLALLTDLYQLTMAYGYWKSGMAEKEAVFHLLFRNNPFNSGFSIACGLHTAVEMLENFHFEKEDLTFLAGLRGNDDKPLFIESFLSYLEKMTFSCDMDAVPEGTPVFAYEPLIRVTGPLVQGQIIETMLLNSINFQTLMATKGARVFLAAQGDPVLEFGLRRAQGIDGALTASRAAHIGGCAATSNVLAGKLFGIPVKGTHAHSWVMCFDTELAAFERYAQAMPNNCIFLVDTYDTLQGVRNAAEVGRRLRNQGHNFVGIRLDSGDLACLSIEARNILDQAGFTDALILASNDLDEHMISSLKAQGATISVWGVGTKLATAYDQPALGGVYKLSAIREPGEPWRYKVKISEQVEKTSLPGVLQIRRFNKDNRPAADVVYDIDHVPRAGCTPVDPVSGMKQKKLTDIDDFEDLLVPVFRQGKRVYDLPEVFSIRQRTIDQLNRFQAGIKRLVNPQEYAVGLEGRLNEMKIKLIRGLTCG